MPKPGEPTGKRRQQAPTRAFGAGGGLFCGTGPSPGRRTRAVAPLPRSRAASASSGELPTVLAQLVEDEHSAERPHAQEGPLEPRGAVRALRQLNRCRVVRGHSLRVPGCSGRNTRSTTFRVRARPVGVRWAYTRSVSPGPECPRHWLTVLTLSPASGTRSAAASAGFPAAHADAGHDCRLETVLSVGPAEPSGRRWASDVAGHQQLPVCSRTAVASGASTSRGRA